MHKGACRGRPDPFVRTVNGSRVWKYGVDTRRWKSAKKPFTTAGSTITWLPQRRSIRRCVRNVRQPDCGNQCVSVGTEPYPAACSSSRAVSAESAKVTPECTSAAEMVWCPIA